MVSFEALKSLFKNIKEYLNGAIVKIQDGSNDTLAGVDSDNAIRVGIYNETEGRIKAATEDMQNQIDTDLNTFASNNKIQLDKIYDEVYLPNESIVLMDLPPPDYTLAAVLDTRRCNTVVGSVYVDSLLPASVQLLFSNDNVNYFPADISVIDVSTLKINEYTTFEIKPYTRYVKLVLTTGTNPPYRVELALRGVRP